MPNRTAVALCGLICACSVGLTACSDYDDDNARIEPEPIERPSSPPAGPLTDPLADAAQPLPTPPGDAEKGNVAVAHIEPVFGIDENKVSGSIHFAPTSTGMELSGRLLDLPTGKHGLHIHALKSCDNPGEHFAPDSKQHGNPQQGEHHAGDLGNIEADTANEAWISMNIDGLALQGEHSILGRALVVHAGEDDLKTQPSGNSGDVIACGVIEPDGDAEVRPESQATSQAQPPPAVSG